MPLWGWIIYSFEAKRRSAQADEGPGRAADKLKRQPVAGLMCSQPLAALKCHQKRTWWAPPGEMLKDLLVSDFAFPHVLGSICLWKAYWNFLVSSPHLENKGLGGILNQSAFSFWAFWPTLFAELHLGFCKGIISFGSGGAFGGHVERVPPPQALQGWGKGPSQCPDGS